MLRLRFNIENDLVCVQKKRRRKSMITNCMFSFSGFHLGALFAHFENFLAGSSTTSTSISSVATNTHWMHLFSRDEHSLSVASVCVASLLRLINNQMMTTERDASSCRSLEVDRKNWLNKIRLITNIKCVYFRSKLWILRPKCKLFTNIFERVIIKVLPSFILINHYFFVS